MSPLTDAEAQAPMAPVWPAVSFYWRDDPLTLRPLLDRIRASGELAVVGTRTHQWPTMHRRRSYCAWRDGERVTMPWGTGRIPGVYESAEEALLALRSALGVPPAA